MNTITSQNPASKAPGLPDLTLRKDTLDNLAAVFAQWDELKHHEYPKVSEMLASDNGGFFDKSRYPDTNK